jgi:hypothetical protein
MAKITSVVARYSGTVTFTDNTKQYFHCQMENDRFWAVDPTGSHDAQKKICWFYKPGVGYQAWVRQLLAWRGLPFLTNAYIDTVPMAVTQEINDIVLRGEITFALDDNTTYPATLVYDSWGGFQWITPGVLNATNKAEYVDKLETMLKQIVNVANLTPA